MGDFKTSEAMTDKQLNKLEKSKKETYFYIVNDGYFFRPASSGYTALPIYAGIYEKTDAIKKARSCRNLMLIEINPKNTIKKILDVIKDIASRLLSE